MPPKNKAGLEPLIVTQRSGEQMYVPDYTNPEVLDYPSVNLIERAIYLQNTLELFAATNEQNGLVTRLKSRYKQPPPEFSDPEVRSRAIEGAKAKAQILFSGAQAEFARAFGTDILIENGADEAEVQKDTRDAFRDFWKEFGLPSAQKKRKQEWQKLDEDIRFYQDIISAENRRKGERPHQKKPYEPSGLDTPERLQALLDDPRAGFLPATTEEKNQVLSFLDYLDNPEYPLGVRAQLLEVFFHQAASSDVRQYDRVRGVDAIRSITYEFGDWLADALTQTALLRELDEQIYQIDKPSLTLAEAIGPEHPAYPALFRYLDIKTYLKQKSTKSIGLNPLRTQRDETTIDYPQKNKTLTGPYTAKKLTKVAAKRLAKLPRLLTIGELRPVPSMAIANEEKRAVFARMILEDLANSRTFLTGQWAARQVLQKLLTPAA